MRSQARSWSVRLRPSCGAPSGGPIGDATHRRFALHPGAGKPPPAFPEPPPAIKGSDYSGCSAQRAAFSRENTTQERKIARPWPKFVVWARPETVWRIPAFVAHLPMAFRTLKQFGNASSKDLKERRKMVDVYRVLTLPLAGQRALYRPISTCDVPLWDLNC